MPDIVNRLKFWAENDLAAQYVAEEAAYEIEQLRSENQKLKHHIDLLQTRLYLNKIPHRVEGIDDVSDSQNI
jgi:cell division protein FtsB